MSGSASPPIPLPDDDNHDDARGVSELASAELASLDAMASSHQSNVAARQNQDMRRISASVRQQRRQMTYLHRLRGSARCLHPLQVFEHLERCRIGSAKGQVT